MNNLRKWTYVAWPAKSLTSDHWLLCANINRTVFNDRAKPFQVSLYIAEYRSQQVRTVTGSNLQVALHIRKMHLEKIKWKKFKSLFTEQLWK